MEASLSRGPSERTENLRHCSTRLNCVDRFDSDVKTWQENANAPLVLKAPKTVVSKIAPSFGRTLNKRNDLIAAMAVPFDPAIRAITRSITLSITVHKSNQLSLLRANCPKPAGQG